MAMIRTAMLAFLLALCLPGASGEVHSMQPEDQALLQIPSWTWPWEREEKEAPEALVASESKEEDQPAKQEKSEKMLKESQAKKKDQPAKQEKSAKMLKESQAKSTDKQETKEERKAREAEEAKAIKAAKIEALADEQRKYQSDAVKQPDSYYYDGDDDFSDKSSDAEAEEEDEELVSEGVHREQLHGEDYYYEDKDEPNALQFIRAADNEGADPDAGFRSEDDDSEDTPFDAPRKWGDWRDRKNNKVSKVDAEIEQGDEVFVEKKDHKHHKKDQKTDPKKVLVEKKGHKDSTKKHKKYHEKAGV